MLASAFTAHARDSRRCRAGRTPMDFNEQISRSWQAETRTATTIELTTRINRQRLRVHAQRSLEVLLTLIAVIVFGQALISRSLDPAHWLLLPFFAVFLPLAWTVILRAPRRVSRDLTESTSIYARLRLAQIRTSLRDLWLTRVTARALVAYAITANIFVWTAADSSWHPAGWTLLVYVLIWAIGTWWLNRRLRRAWLREYRAVALSAKH
ncbi:MAG: hypothetical protein ACT4NL_02225 [Pseudomarimonas sp.]